ncbi:TonB-dependent receptor [Granulicella rosea]|uniref:TonB-dependent receptor n=1 Tax=Granulicella rosea TaxID=474952 RepID=UPI001595AA36|nr:TonB-dependent receptor [Granulicella rosea]
MLALLFGAASNALGQARSTGTVAGNITDAKGNVVITAVVTLTSAEQNTTFTANANGKGEYLLTDVPVGTYNLTVSAPNFQNYVISSIAVDAEQNVRLDARLEVGTASESVTVEAAGMTVDTRSATIGTVIDNKLVEELPIDGQNVVALAALLPGVSGVNAPTTFTSDTAGPTFNVSGSRNNQNLFLLDGFLWNNAFYNTGLNFPPPHAMSEVSVLLDNYKAEFGRNAGSVFNAITRRGANTIHGTLWEYLQNSVFDATDWISHQNPHLVQNQFGATLGGPIKRDKAFFFLTFQDLRSAGQVVAIAQTPTYAERGLISPGVGLPCTSTYFAGQTCANFLASFPAGSNPNQVLQNPVYSSTYGATAISQLNSTYAQQGGTGTSPCVTALTAYMNSNNAATTKRYLPNAEIPSNCFNPVAVNFLSQYVPVPNQPSIGNAPPQALSTAKQPRNDYNGMARIDLNLGAHTLDAHFYMTSVNDITSNSVSQGQGIANYEQDRNTGGIAFGGVGDTWVLSSNKLNIFRTGYKRYKYSIDPTDPTTLGALGSALIIPGSPSLPRLEATNQFTLGSATSARSYTLNANYEASDNFSWTKGNHNLQFGAQYLELQYIHRFDQSPFIESEQQNTETSLGDFLLGLIYTETFGNFTNLSAQQHVFYFYGQDDWRASSRLTVSAGLRYELPFQWYQPDGQSLTFIPGYQSAVFPGAPPSMAYVGDHGLGKGIVSNRFNDFAPRVGLAYDVFGNGKTSIRAGFGIFFDAINANIVGVGEPYHYGVTYAQPNGSFSNPLLGQNPIPANYVKGNPQFAGPYSVNFADKNLTTPYTEAFNIGIQQRVLNSATLEINYVGKLGRHQIVQFDLNPAIYDCSGGYFASNPAVYCADASTASSSYQARVVYPGYNYGGQGVVDNASVGTSNYNGMQVIYKQRSRKSLSALASYTYSRSLDIQSNGQTNTANVPMPFNLRSQYGPSDFQATHIFNGGFVWLTPSVRFGPRFMQGLANGWRLGGIFNARSGNPINIYLAGDLSYTDERPQRPNLVPGVSPYPAPGRSRAAEVASWFNTAAFVNPTPGTFGNVSRNSLYGPAFITTNGSVGRFFQLTQGRDLEFKADAFNLFNQPNFANPNTQLASATSALGNFGTIRSTVGTNGVVGTNGRRLQLSLLLHF